MFVKQRLMIPKGQCKFSFSRVDFTPLGALNENEGIALKVCGWKSFCFQQNCFTFARVEADLLWPMPIILVESYKMCLT